MSFELPTLPYDKTALEPHMSAETFDYHHGKHHNQDQKQNIKLPNGERGHYSESFLHGAAPALLPASIIACVAVGLPIKIKLMINKILRASSKPKPSSWVESRQMHPINIITVESVSPFPAACMRV